MAAKYVENVAPGWPRLGHRIRVEPPVHGGALFDVEDRLVTEIHAWVEDHQNETNGLYGLANVEMVDGEGAYYWFGFTDTPTAGRFKERWGKAMFSG